MMWIVDFLIFVSVLSALIITHEFGHFIAARSSGIKVEIFSIGFGPPVFKKKFRDTLFLICMVPLGGYVRLAGDQRDSCEGKEFEFFSKPPEIRAKVVFFGPLFNYILSFFLLWALFMVGMPALDTRIGGVVKDFPAEESGLEMGDKIIEVNGQNISSWEEVQKLIRNSQGDVSFLVLRNDKNLDFNITPDVKESKDVFGREVKHRKVGIYPSFKIVSYNPFVAFFKGLKHLTTITTLIIKGLYFTITGAVPAKEAVAGPIRLFEITSDIAKQGIIALLNLVSVMGVSLAIVNLFPIPVLDGGHLFIFLLEKIRRRPLNDKAEDILNKIGIVIVGLIVFLVFYNDILSIVSKR